MSHLTLAHKGLRALEEKSWDTAVTMLSKALLSSTNPAWLLARSKALANLKRYDEALVDAEVAFLTAHDRNIRDLMFQAQHRRALVYFSLGQFANADCCSIYAMRLCKGLPALEKDDIRALHSDETGYWTATLEEATKEAQSEWFHQSRDEGFARDAKNPMPLFKEWQRASLLRIQSLKAMSKLPEDDVARKVTISADPRHKDLAVTKTESNAQDKIPDAVDPQPATRKSAAPCNQPLRMQDYQTDSAIMVSIFTKGVDKQKLHVEFFDDSVLLDPLVYPNGEEKELVIETHSQIKPSASSFTVTPSKVELRLGKKSPGRWPRLTKEDPRGQEFDGGKNKLEGLQDAGKIVGEAAGAEAEQSISGKEAEQVDGKAGTSEHHGDKSSPKATSAKAREAEPASKPGGPAYPTSSRSGPKNWDAIGADSDEEESNVDDFFKRLYKNASEEQRRAMKKSFVESNGTSLSTDWSDVGSRTVEVVAPEGVEAKKW
ncbi:uncharacterized protein UV8b_06633 [Ustilaginoidea virens]|uniref:SGT1 and CS domain containing protein n=1 Tax=Ustilaginoidea virens TaxID=1159556 RepID=A0A1B5L4U6_USTVR|nr:uncharacterized protein UV8b_06633 [Ustilaginoidea virens]QUC22392.1 hypothetical protein UV8b_06633 [Ustilaginoidea virens]GAO18525.1 hypothetical protein UVI_02054670 [Ustilaginoidea virens]